MPLYDFACVQCGHHFDELVSWQQKNNVRCPQCGGEAKDKISAFAVKGGAAGSAAPASAPRFT